MTAGTESKEQILRSFDKLVQERKKDEARIALRGEEAAAARDREVLNKASGYTVESIVKGLADLQLGFAGEIERLTSKLGSESEKVGELKTAIEVETRNLATLRNIKVIADAAYIRTQEMQDKRAELDEWIQDKRDDFNEDVTRQREAWQQEQTEHEAACSEFEANLAKNRAQEEADHKYDTERKQKIEEDKFNDQKMQLERTLSEERADLEKSWAQREEALANTQSTHEENLQKIAAFPDKLTEETQKAREEGIRKATSEAKIQAELTERDVAASTQVFELKIESLDRVIAEQQTQIQDLMAQLKVALDRSQNLAVRAIDKSKNKED